MLPSQCLPLFARSSLMRQGLGSAWGNGKSVQYRLWLPAGCCPLFLLASCGLGRPVQQAGQRRQSFNLCSLSMGLFFKNSAKLL